MGRAVFPPCCLTWGQTMVEVMKIMETSFKRSHAGTAALSAPSPAAGRRWSLPPLEPPGDSRPSLGQSLAGSLLLSRGSWCAQVFVCALQDCVFQSSVSSSGSTVGLMATSSKKAYAVSRSAAPRAPAPPAVYCWPTPPQETLKHSPGSVSVGALGPGAHKVCLSPLTSLVGMGCDSKCDFAPPAILLWLLFCPCMWGVFSWWDPTFFCWCVWCRGQQSCLLHSYRRCNWIFVSWISVLIFIFS